jgi:hypothetical protein
MNSLTAIGIFISVLSGFFIALTIYACNYVTHSCFDVSLNIPVVIFFSGLACISLGILESETGMER